MKSHKKKKRKHYSYHKPKNYLYRAKALLTESRNMMSRLNFTISIEKGFIQDHSEPIDFDIDEQDPIEE